MRYWVLSVILILAFLIQSVASNYLSFYYHGQQIAPNFPLVVVVTYALLFGWRVGLSAAVLGGLLVDLISGRYVGVNVLSLGIVGLLIGQVEERVFKDNILLGPAAGLVGSIIGQLIVLFCLWLFGWQIDFVYTLRYMVLPTALYAMGWSLLIYRFVYKYYQYLRPDTRGTIVIRR